MTSSLGKLYAAYIRSCVLCLFSSLLMLQQGGWRDFQKSRSYNKNLKIIETIAVGNNKLISIVAVGKK